MMPFLDSDLAALEPVPKSTDPADVAAFVDRRVVAANKAILRHMDVNFQRLEKRLLSAFPEDDPALNRQTLTALIDAQRARAQFYNDLRNRLTERGLLALIGALAVAAWFYLREHVLRGGQ